MAFKDDWKKGAHTALLTALSLAVGGIIGTTVAIPLTLILNLVNALPIFNLTDREIVLWMAGTGVVLVGPWMLTDLMAKMPFEGPGDEW